MLVGGFRFGNTRWTVLGLDVKEKGLVMQARVPVVLHPRPRGDIENRTYYSSGLAWVHLDWSEINCPRCAFLTVTAGEKT